MSDNLILPDSRNTRADAQKNHALLLETAQRLFDEQGVEVVSMTAIAEAAGVGKGTLYRHFRDKMELCRALLDQEQRDLQERTLRRLAGTSEPLEKLRWFLAEVVHFVVQNEALLCVSSASRALPTLRHPAHFWWHQTITGLLRQAHAAQDVQYVADVLYVMIDVRTVQFLRRERGYTTERVIDNLHALLERVIP